jgi:hypothetical protein
MLGTYQKSHLRIEVEASEQIIRDSLLETKKLIEWMWPQNFPSSLPEKLNTGLTFTSWLGLLAIDHEVQMIDENCLRLLLSKSIDGYHEWYWGEGWVQSRLEGISLLPLNLGQTFSLLKLKRYLASQLSSSN